MFGRRIDLFKVFGFKVSIDLRWVVLAIRVARSLLGQQQVRNMTDSGSVEV